MASRKFLVDIDLDKNQLLNARLQNSASNLSGPSAGAVYFHTTNKTVYVYDGTAWIDLGNSGTVKTVSVNSANGFGGTSSGGENPALTINTTVTGIVKGNGSGISAATVGVDYSGGTSLLGTGILKTTTGTGALSTAVASDFPTLNQNTTGSAATLTTPRNINNVPFNGSTDITVTAAAGTLTGTTLASNVTASSLTSFGATPTFATGATAVTQAPGTNNTSLATTGFVMNVANTKAPTNNPTFTGTVTVPLTPTSPTDAASKGYVDSMKQALDIKDSVRVATTANINLATGLVNNVVIDGVTVKTGDRVLVKDQTTASQNGIYVVVASGAASRSTDANDNLSVTSGLYTFVSEGSASASMGYVLTTPDPIVLNTTALTFTQFSGAGQVDAGAGLVKSGNTINAVGTANRIIVNTDSIDIGTDVVTLNGTQVLTNKTINGSQITGAVPLATTVTTNANMTGAVTSVGNTTSLGSFSSANLSGALTDKTGTGTNVFSVSPALTGTPTAPTAATGDNTTQIATTAFVKAQGYATIAGSVTKYVAVLPTNGTNTTITIPATTHLVGTSGDFIVQLKDLSTNQQVEAEIVTNNSTGNVSVIFNVAPLANTYKIIILG